jgi:dihydrolipoamide dehydrogenase
VTLVERDIVGGAAHLLDCVPSKAMTATASSVAFTRRIRDMGLAPVEAQVDIQALKRRVETIKFQLEFSVKELLASQKVRILQGKARLLGPNEAVVRTPEGVEELRADYILIATGSRPRVPDFCTPDGERILTTRDCYPPPDLPEHLIVVGSGVTGVEFVNLFSSLGSRVTLIVSRQQVLPRRDPEVAAVLEQEFLERGVELLKGAKASSIECWEKGVRVGCTDGRSLEGSHVLLAVGSVPNTEDMGLDTAGVVMDEAGYIPIDQDCRTNIPHIYAAGDVSGKLPLSSVASMQGRRVAYDVMGLGGLNHRELDYDKAASAIFTVPEIADVGLAEAEAVATGRKVRVTKVPFSATAKAAINSEPQGFVKIISDPATGIVLGGSIVGRHAAELISVIALAVGANLRVGDIAESLMVHPSLSEALADAAD